jgi:two-component system OmpR family sensor kinase
LSGSAALLELLPEGDGDLILASVSAACAVSAAIMAASVHWLSTDRRAAWISAACTLYGLVGISADAVTSTFHHVSYATDAIRLSSQLGGALLLAVAVAPPYRRRSVNPLSLSVVGLSGVLVAALAASIAPAAVEDVVAWPPMHAAVAVAVVLVGLAMVVAAQVDGSRELSRIGLAMTALAGAHIYRVAVEQPGVPMVYAGVQFLSMFLALWGLKQLAGQAYRAVRASEVEHEEMLGRARIGLARAADRDLELRTGLAGLAEVTQLLGQAPGEASQELCRAVFAELSRLETMMAEEGMRPDPRPYPVGPVIRNLVTLRRCAGMDIRYDGDDVLRAVGSSGVLTQVVANVLANAARHAPGSPVRIQACRRSDRIRVRISDFGPGIPPGSELAVFGRGTRSETGGGQGLGLHICRELLAAGGGEIEIRSTPAIRTGCTVIVELPAAAIAGSRGDLVPVSNAS